MVGFLAVGGLTLLRTGVAAVIVGMLWAGVTLAGEAAAQDSSGTQIMQQFSQADVVDQANEFSTQEKHQVMFGMGFALLVLILATAVLGIAMAIFGKQVFVAHMVCAGLSVTLAIAHSIVAIVWFFPF